MRGVMNHLAHGHFAINLDTIRRTSPTDSRPVRNPRQRTQDDAIRGTADGVVANACDPRSGGTASVKSKCTASPPHHDESSRCHNNTRRHIHHRACAWKVVYNTHAPIPSSPPTTPEPPRPTANDVRRCHRLRRRCRRNPVARRPDPRPDLRPDIPRRRPGHPLAVHRRSWTVPAPDRPQDPCAPRQTMDAGDLRNLQTDHSRDRQHATPQVDWYDSNGVAPACSECGPYIVEVRRPVATTRRVPEGNVRASRKAYPDE